MRQTPLLTSDDETQESPTLERALFTAVVPPLDGEFIYEYNRHLHPELQVGYVVQVPLGKRETHAYITSINSAKEDQTKNEMAARGKKIKAIPDNAETALAFSEEHLAFYEWIAKYYSEPLSKIIDLAVPTPAHGKPPTGYVMNKDFSSEDLESTKLTQGQRAVIELMRQSSSPLDSKTIQASCGASAAVLRGLVKKSFVVPVELTSGDNEEARHDLTTIIPPELNSEQQSAAAQIRQLGKKFSTTLLQGVTGSGKTEVYLSLIIETLARGMSALVMVPEIALTPQLTERFISRLKIPVAVLHSSLKPKERWKHWSDLSSGKVRVAIGARSAIFAPLKDLGIIIVDEEHDSSFKQGEGIRYHARDLALVRAKLSECPVILGSATPSLESYHNATSGKYLHLHLKERYHDAAASSFEIVDLNNLKPWHMKSKNISPKFFSGLQSALTRGGQAFILYNKRGFASYLQCSSCEHVLGCPHCSVTLTYHRNFNSLVCHQCGFTLVPPAVCSGCGAREKLETDAEPLFTHRGSGTERVHEELETLFPSARIAVLDRDTASSVQDYVEILRRVREREVDILVGTQMIAKGHDLPGVIFVGIVDCDVGLHIPDFRAAERAFQLLTQVSGRAGRRSERGHVILQTRVPSHPSLIFTATSKYDEFALAELKLRKELCYPPFHKLLRIIVSSSDRNHALKRASQVAGLANSLAASLQAHVLGPAPAPIEKIRTLWRYHLLIRSPSAASLQHAMKQIKKVFQSDSETRVSYDLDPHDML
jgi:primosomal protein N' (replication factor Y)